MGTIITIVVGFFVLCFMYGVIGFLMAKFPALIWICGIIGGITVAIMSSYWWAGLIAGFFLIGVLSHAQSVGGHKCAHCGSYDTDIKGEEDGIEFWVCNKCNGGTYGRKH
mgnify:CR=1 FL=1